MSLENRGRRECRVPNAPAASRAKSSEAHERSHHGHTGITRHSPRNGFTAYFVLSPATNSCCHRRWRIKGSSNPVGLDFASASLTPATGARTTRLHRPLKRRSSCTPLIAHEVHLALQLPCAPDALTSTASRPALVTTRDRPSCRNETAMDMHLIWVGRKRKYFCKGGWTGALAKHQLICPSGKVFWMGDWSGCRVLTRSGHLPKHRCQLSAHFRTSVAATTSPVSAGLTRPNRSRKGAVFLAERTPRATMATTDKIV